jgi:predicted nucleic acid-binding protein
VVVPEIVDYELRRELLRARKTASVARLDAFNSSAPDRYLPVTTVAIRRAAELWADVRQRGLPTTDPRELDVDVILAAQALTAGLSVGDLIVARSNPIHLSRFLTADLWQNV